MSVHRPLRSVLYIPASKPRALEKARSLPVDAIIFDLEDAVTPDEKAAARDTLAAALAEDGYGTRMKIVRINGLCTQWGADDARAVVEMAPDAVLIPKVNSPADLDAATNFTGNLPLWAMMETPQAMLNAQFIAGHELLQAMVMGTNDLAKELQTRFRPDRAALLSGIGLCLLAARSHGLSIIDGVYNAFKDDEGLERNVSRAVILGLTARH